MKWLLIRRCDVNMVLATASLVGLASSMNIRRFRRMRGGDSRTQMRQLQMLARLHAVLKAAGSGE
ncbi:hypothetical protein CWO90_34690 [Bradyrhizobium sp. Leo121]|nr:hypothetical protein CWO90_34690 [Bradyrhizobium sp. Leo121]